MVLQMIVQLIVSTWEKNGEQVVKLLLDYLTRRLQTKGEVEYDSKNLPPELVSEVEGILNGEGTEGTEGTEGGVTDKEGTEGGVTDKEGTEGGVTNA